MANAGDPNPLSEYPTLPARRSAAPAPAYLPPPGPPPLVAVTQPLVGEASERSLTLPPRGYLPQKTLEKAAPTPTLQLPIRVELRLEDSRGDVGEESVAKTALGLRRTADRYRIEAEIGRGGMAVVYRAFDRDLRRQVAMKVMREGFGIDEELTAKFVEEAQTTAQLQHPGIVPVFEIGLNEESRLFFTMKLVRGTTLSEIVSRLRGGDAELRRDYTVFRLLQVFVDIARAVSYAHERGVTHRDLKPQNIMIGRFGEVMVMDWGLAHVIQLERRPGDGGRTGISVSGGRRSQSRGEVWGTAGYMPPEQAIGDKESLGAWSDVFSLGAILYFILTGHAPFEGTYEEQLAQTIAGEPKPARAYEPAVARELDAIARKALQREPKDRYASARALADDVQAFLEGLPVTAHPDNALRRLIKLAQRHRAIARTIAAALFVGLLGATFGIARFERERHLYEQTTHEWHTAEEAARFERERAQRDRARAYAEMGRGALADGDFLSAEVLFAAAVGSDDRQATREGLLEARAHGLRLVWAATDDDHAATIAMSPDGRTVASGGDGCVVRLRDAATGAIKATLKGHRGAVRGLAFSPDGRYLASASDDRTVHIWEVANGFDLATLAGHEGPVYSVAFSPDGRSIATGSDDRAIRIWDTQSGRSLRTLAGHEGLVYGVAWSPDGRRLASGGWDSTVRIWNPATGKEEMRLRSHGGWVYRVAFAEKGRLLAAGTDAQRVLLFDLETGQEVLAMRGHKLAVSDVAFAPARRWLGSASRDNTVRIWQADAGREVCTIRTRAGDAESCSIAFTPDGRRVLAGGSDRGLRCWEFEAAAEAMVLGGHTREVWSATFDPEGSRLASAGRDGAFRVWDARTGKEVYAIPEAHDGGISDIAFSPDGRRLATAGEDHTVRIWMAATGVRALVIEGHKAEVSALAWSPDGKRIASASWDRTVRITDLATGVARVLEGHTASVIGVVWSPDGRELASSSYDGTVKVWDAEKAVLLRTLEGHEHQVEGVAWSPDGALIASGSWDKTVRLWDAATGAPAGTLTGHTGSVYGLGFDADGRRLASASEDGTVRLWDVAARKELFALRGHRGEVISAVFDPAGRRLASASFDKTVRIWDLAAVERIFTAPPEVLRSEAERDSGLGVEDVERIFGPRDVADLPPAGAGNR